MIYPGFKNGECEVFYIYKNDKLIFIVEGNIYHFPHIPSNILCFFENELNSDIVANSCLDDLGLIDYYSRLRQFIICRYGGQDLLPDLVSGKLCGDYYKCRKRGVCKHEFKLCSRVCSTKTGNTLTRCEIEVVKQIANDLPDKIIADNLHLSEFTVKNHRANISGKLGVHTKNGIVRFAIEKNITA